MIGFVLIAERDFQIRVARPLRKQCLDAVDEQVIVVVISRILSPLARSKRLATLGACPSAGTLRR